MPIDRTRSVIEQSIIMPVVHDCLIREGDVVTISSEVAVRRTNGLDQVCVVAISDAIWSYNRNVVFIAIGKVEIFTTSYNPKDIFRVGAYVYTGLNGQFTTTKILNEVGQVISSPTDTDIYLGVYYKFVWPPYLYHYLYLN